MKSAKIFIVTIFTFIFSYSFSQQVIGHWDKERSTVKEIHLEADRRTWQRIDLPVGTTELAIRITLIETHQQMANSLVDLLNAVPSSYTKGTAAGISLLSAISGNDKCKYYIFENADLANAYISNGTYSNACYANPTEINKDVIFLKNNCVTSHPEYLFFAFRSMNVIQHERIILEVVPWVDVEASRGWTKQFKEEFYNKCLEGVKSEEQASSVKSPEGLCSCLLEKFQQNHKLTDIQQRMASNEIDKLAEQYALKCMEETGEVANVYSKVREEADTLTSEGKFGEAIPKYLEIINSGKADVMVYNNLGWCYILTKQYLKSIKYLREGEKFDETELMIKGNLAHAYLLNGDIDLAKNIYLKYKNQNIDEETGWSDSVKQDFDYFKSKGVSCERYEEIISLLK